MACTQGHFVLLYDVLQGGYFPEPEQREHMLRSIDRC